MGKAHTEKQTEVSPRFLLESQIKTIYYYSMNLIFFQNCISPHQMPYIACLPAMPEVGRVVVVAPLVDMDERKAMGWDADKYLHTAGVEVRIAPTDAEVQQLLQHNPADTVCLFSGINAFPEVRHWIDLSVPFAVRRAIITERPNLHRHPLWMHRARFWLKDRPLAPLFSDVFVMGDDFVDYYRRSSSQWRVHPFLYCTEWTERQHFPLADPARNIRLLFVGGLFKRKSVATLANALQLMPTAEAYRIEVGIVGDGPLRRQLEERFRATPSKVMWHGTQPHDKVTGIMQQYDALVLPSTHDGWGAVVNEALTLGLYIVVSDKCGARMVVGNDTVGRVFRAGSPRSLQQVLTTMPTQEAITNTIATRIDYARRHIAPQAVARRLVDGLREMQH
ncbi:MAG: glycosyltransferase family 4 protein [Bacteroidaceae bacterium]|nr:glycosyltransferase family 4 protein [Bacteroidaceae bacterium]